MSTSNHVIPISKPWLGEDEKAGVLAVLESGMIAQGAKVIELEKQFTALCKTKNAVAVNSGTSGLHLALLANGVGPGDEVITTPFTFIATVNSILMAEAKPVFVDIDPKNFNLDPNLIERAITERTRAIMPVHLFGQMCDIETTTKIARRYNLAVIEDACQAVGASWHGIEAGSMGTGVFSLYATKNITSGEGGMITTNDDHVAEKCRKLRNHGMQEKYQHEMMGFNYRMSDIHAAVGLAQISRLEVFLQLRKRNAGYFNEMIRTVITPTEQEGCVHAWHQYTVRIDNAVGRDEAVQFLNRAGIGTGVFYPTPLHRYPHIQAVIGEMSFPEAERAARQVLSLPVHPSLSHEELDYIAQTVNQL